MDNDHRMIITPNVVVYVLGQETIVFNQRIEKARKMKTNKNDSLVDNLNGLLNFQLEGVFSGV